jgi:hypothetical protein
LLGEARRAPTQPQFKGLGLDELGWELHEPGSALESDGLTQWFVEFTNASGDCGR